MSVHCPSLSGLFGALASQPSPFGSVLVAGSAGSIAERADPACRALAAWTGRRRRSASSETAVPQTMPVGYLLPA